MKNCARQCCQELSAHLFGITLHFEIFYFFSKRISDLPGGQTKTLSVRACCRPSFPETLSVNGFFSEAEDLPRLLCRFQRPSIGYRRTVRM